MEYTSPRYPNVVVTLKNVALSALLAGLAQVAPPEIVTEVVRSLQGEETIENPLHPDNAIRQDAYHAEAWEIIARNYLINGVVVDWDEWAIEETAKMRDVLGDRAPHSRHMTFLRYVFTDPEQPQQLSDLANAVQTLTFFKVEEASRLARLFQYPEKWSEYIRHGNTAQPSTDFAHWTGLLV